MLNCFSFLDLFHGFLRSINIYVYLSVFQNMQLWSTIILQFKHWRIWGKIGVHQVINSINIKRPQIHPFTLEGNLAYINLLTLKDFRPIHTYTRYSEIVLLEELHVLFVCHILEVFTVMRNSYNFLSFTLTMRKIVMTKLIKSFCFLDSWKPP